jgi:hypothetical protein
MSRRPIRENVHTFSKKFWGILEREPTARGCRASQSLSGHATSGATAS